MKQLLVSLLLVSVAVFTNLARATDYTLADVNAAMSAAESRTDGLNYTEVNSECVTIANLIAELQAKIDEYNEINNLFYALRSEGGTGSPPSNNLRNTGNTFSDNYSDEIESWQDGFVIDAWQEMVDKYGEALDAQANATNAAWTYFFSSTPTNLAALISACNAAMVVINELDTKVEYVASLGEFSTDVLIWRPITENYDRPERDAINDATEALQSKIDALVLVVAGLIIQGYDTPAP